MACIHVFNRADAAILVHQGGRIPDNEPNAKTVIYKVSVALCFLKRPYKNALDRKAIRKK